MSVENLDFSVLDLPQNQKILNIFKTSVNTLSCNSALNLLKQECINGCILSYNEKLDEVFRNILVPKKIIEFTGHFECSTPVCFRLCVTVQMPKTHGGCGGEAFYISTNSNFSIDKLKEVATEFFEEYPNILEEFNVEYILDHIYYTKVINPLEFTACLYKLERILQQKEIRLLIVDSISYILRQLDGTERFKLTNKVIQLLRYLSIKYNLCVIITNFCTTRIDGDKAYITASFGDSFYHLVNSRFSFTRISNDIQVKVAKSLIVNEKETVII
ncbi:unnamed protein product [Phyllotreta striolata]|uniref:Rad51-like C-terminal domain-containing protein n=1 Tax=Phyllotreta striolata TaxID=444603 RepID=A0A9N9TA09_PHYSR|nr:unnamed protein product [Phyllotreta striolata]